MEFIIGLIQSYGYIVLFIGTLLEGETVAALAGYMAYQEYLSLPIVMVVAFVGAYLGDQIFFQIGRRRGRSFLARRPGWTDKVEQIYTRVQKHETLVIIGSRFMYGFRAALPVVLGTSSVSTKRFMALNGFGAIVWSIVFPFGGYVFGEAVEVFIGKMKRLELRLFIAALVVLVVLVTMHYFRKRMEPKLVASMGGSSSPESDPLDAIEDVGKSTLLSSEHSSS